MRLVHWILSKLFPLKPIVIKHKSDLHNFTIIDHTQIGLEVYQKNPNRGNNCTQRTHAFNLEQ